MKPFEDPPSLPLPPSAPPGRSPAPPPALRSSLRFYRPDAPKVPSLPSGDPKDRFADWYAAASPLLPPGVATMPRRWEIAFPTQLRDWRERSQRLQHQAEAWHHGMIPGQTWMFPVPIPEGESIHLDSSQARTLIQPSRQRLVLVCLPPQVVLKEGDRLAVSDPRDLERSPNASRMPQEVLTVPSGPRLLLAHELESLAWAASEDREALVGELLEG